MSDPQDNRIGLLLTPDILHELDLLWPDHCPSPTDDEMLIKCARREVITVLHAKFAQANPNSPDTKVL